MFQFLYKCSLQIANFMKDLLYHTNLIRDKKYFILLFMFIDMKNNFCLICWENCVFKKFRKQNCKVMQFSIIYFTNIYFLWKKCFKVWYNFLNSNILMKLHVTFSKQVASKSNNFILSFLYSPENMKFMFNKWTQKHARIKSICTCNTG